MKKSEFLTPLLTPAFMFACTCFLFNQLDANIAFATIVTGSILFIIFQIVVYKFFKNKIPDVLMRTAIFLLFVAVLSGCYVSGLLSLEEIKFSLIFLGFVLVLGIRLVFQGIKR